MGLVFNCKITQNLKDMQAKAAPCLLAALIILLRGTLKDSYLAILDRIADIALS